MKLNDDHSNLALSKMLSLSKHYVPIVERYWLKFLDDGCNPLLRANKFPFSGEGQTLETSIIKFILTNFSFFTFPPTQYHSSFRK